MITQSSELMRVAVEAERNEVRRVQYELRKPKSAISNKPSTLDVLITEVNDE